MANFARLVAGGIMIVFLAAPASRARDAHSGPGRGARSSGPLNVREYGARGDGVTDDTAAFEAAIAEAVRTDDPRRSNTGAKIQVPCGKYILTARLVIATGPNAAIGLYGDTASCTELQWNVADGGIDFELPAQVQTSPSRSAASPAGGTGVGIDVEHLSLVNNAPGNGYTGTALRIDQPIPTRSIASGGPDQTISDLRWYSRAPGGGGRAAEGQAWRVGIELSDAPFTHIEHVTGTQWGTRSPLGPPSSVGVHIVSKGGAHDYFQQQVWISDYAQQGAYRGIGIDGHNLQGLYASGLFLLENAVSIDWKAPSADASASFTLTNSSLDGEFAGIFLLNVRQVMVSNTEILSPGDYGTPMRTNYYGVFAADADNLMLTNNTIIPACQACASSAIAAGFKGYGVYVLDQVPDDGQGSVISGNSIAYGDVGVGATGSMILVSGNSIAAAVPTPLLDGGAGSSVHPVFQDNLWGRHPLSATLPVDSGIAFYGPAVVPGAVATLTAAQDGGIVRCAGTLERFTFGLPMDPVQGQTVTLASECSITSLAIVPQPATAGIKVVGVPAGITPAIPIKLIYDAASRTWLPWS